MASRGRTGAHRSGDKVTEDADARLRSKGVFISYRRGETSGQARALHELLSQRFGAGRVFMDVDSIAPGADFVEKIEEAIHSSGVALVLIGRDWLSRGTHQHLLDDPSDFVRLETDTALRLGVPVIPILVERAQMPSLEELPESLRPLARRNALELENTRWEFDVGRLVRAVEQLVDPTPGPAPEPDKHRNGSEGDEQLKRAKRTRPSLRVLLAGLGTLVVVIALVVFLLRPPGPGSVSAAHAVAAVSPERLAGLVLGSRLDPNDVPNNMSPDSPILSSVLTPHLLDDVLVPVLGPAPYLAIHYLVFDGSSVASSYFANTLPLPDGYAFTGSFATTGITDPTRCDTGRARPTAPPDASRSSSCAALSANVISFIEVTSGTSGAAADDNLAVALSRAAIRHLSVVAGAAPTAAVPPPPGSLAPEVLSKRIASTPLGDLLPEYVSLLGLGHYSFGPGSPAGLVAGSYVDASLKGNGHRDSVYFYVFDTARQAKAFDTDLAPPGYHSMGLIISSGFSQPASCHALTNSSPTSPSGYYASACAVLWGDVVVYSEAGPAQNPTAEESPLAVTLARMAVIDLDRLDSN